MPYGWRVKDPDKFISDLVRGLHDFGDEVFKQSQVDCPVDLGTLKDSGEMIPTENGFIIHYRTSYAARQEFGIEPGTVEHVDKHKVKRHTRLMKRKQGGAKKVGVRGHWRGPFDRYYKDGMPGKFYLTNAFEMFKPRLVKFITRISRS